MLGVLVKGDLDDGRGKARVNLFRHKHEIESGRTSSVGMEIMGFDSKSEVVVSNVPGRKLTWEEIGRRSVGPISCHIQISSDIHRPKSLAFLISQDTNGTCVPRCLACCRASLTTVC